MTHVRGQRTADGVRVEEEVTSAYRTALEFSVYSIVNSSVYMSDSTWCNCMVAGPRPRRPARGLGFMPESCGGCRERLCAVWGVWTVWTPAVWSPVRVRTSPRSERSALRGPVRRSSGRERRPEKDAAGVGRWWWKARRTQPCVQVSKKYIPRSCVVGATASPMSPCGVCESISMGRWTMGVGRGRAS